MDSLTTRPAGAADIGWLTDVFLRSLREPISVARGAWDEAREQLQFREQLELGRTQVIQLRGADIGFLMSQEHGDQVELHTLCIAPEYQSQGIGTYITRRLVSDAQTSGRCGSGFWGGQRPSLAHYVTGMGPMDGATAARGRSCCNPQSFPFEHRF
jgi:ribosomal protein S18 acetylase RimI-like enzyme